MVEMSKEGYVSTLGPETGAAGWGSGCCRHHLHSPLWLRAVIWTLFHWPSLPGDARGAQQAKSHWLAFPPTSHPTS